MPGSDASIYSMIRPQATVRLEDPNEIQAKRLTLGNLMQQRQMGEIQMRGALRDEQTGDQLRGLFGRNSAPTDAEVMAIDPLKAGPAYLKQKREGLRADADLQKVDRENFIALADHSRKSLSTVTPESWASYRDGMIQSAGMFKTPEIRALAMKAAETLPAQFDPQYVRNSLVKAEELFTPRPVERTDGQKKWMEDTNPFTNPAILTRAPTQMQQTPESVASNATTRRGQNMVDARQRDANDTAAGNQAVSTEGKLRDDYNKASSDFVKVRDAHQRVIASAEKPSAAGDLALIFNYMKVLDPGSTVREGEFATAQNSGSIPERIRAQYNKAIAGERLSDVIRNDFVDRSGKLYQAAETNQKTIEQQYTDISKRSRANPENVVSPQRIVEAPAAAPKDAKPIRIAGDDGYNALPKGALYVGPDGVTRRK